MLKAPSLCGLVAFCILMTSPASADSVYLKNGRVIHCDWTRVEGEYLVFGQYGGEVKIPLHAVERVEEDAETEPAAVPTPSQEEYRAELVRRYAEAGLSSPVPGQAAGGASAGQGGESAGGAASEERGTPEAATVGTRRGEWRHLPPDTREYWQLRVADTEEQIMKVEAEIARLPEYNHVEERILDGRILWVIQEKERLAARVGELQADLMIIREDARKSGIPPGWLR